jgi:hypothetical protein
MISSKRSVIFWLCFLNSFLAFEAPFGFNCHEFPSPYVPTALIILRVVNKVTINESDRFLKLLFDKEQSTVSERV